MLLYLSMISLSSLPVWRDEKLLFIRCVPFCFQCLHVRHPTMQLTRKDCEQSRHCWYGMTCSPATPLRHVGSRQPGMHKAWRPA